MKKYCESKGIRDKQFSYTQITVTEITKMLRGLDTSKATGLDAIPAKFLRDAAEVIAPYVTHMINLLISQSKVPQALKNTRVTASYKKGSKVEQDSYRSVSVLSVFSKILD